MFGDKEPEADHGATDLVGKELAHAALNARGVARFWFRPLFGPLGFDRWLRVWVIPVKFFL
jgi:hypothetical protein